MCVCDLSLSACSPGHSSINYRNKVSGFLSFFLKLLQKQGFRVYFFLLEVILLILCNQSRTWGAGIAQWLERRTCDQKVAGLNHCWSGVSTFFSRVNFLC